MVVVRVQGAPGPEGFLESDYKNTRPGLARRIVTVIPLRSSEPGVPPSFKLPRWLSPPALLLVPTSSPHS